MTLIASEVIAGGIRVNVYGVRTAEARNIRALVAANAITDAPVGPVWRHNRGIRCLTVTMAVKVVASGIPVGTTAGNVEFLDPL